MRRFSLLLIGLLAIASPLTAQNSNNCGQAATSRTFPAPGKVRYSTGMTCDQVIDTLLITDSIQVRQLQALVNSLTKSLADTSAALKVAKDSITKLLAVRDTVKPVPPDTTRPVPPVDDRLPRRH